MKPFKIASIQTRPILRGVSNNIKRAEELIRRAVLKDVQVVTLPETFDTGYDLPWIKKNAENTFPETKSFLESLSKELNIYIVAGIANERRGSLYNSSLVFSPKGKVVASYNKNFLFRGAPQEEHKYFKEAKGFAIADTAFGKFGLAICNDIRYPQLFSGQALEGARIIFVSSAWSMKRLDHWNTLLKARALENQIYIVAANQTGKSPEVEFCGHSQIIDFDGNILAEKELCEGYIIAEINYKALEIKRKELPTFKRLGSDPYGLTLVG